MLNGKDDNNQSVARLIVNPPRGYVVRFKNNDRMDLRRKNSIMKTRKEVKEANMGIVQV